MGLAGILSELEGEGYEVRVFGIPACAVGSPHIRNRYWIVAHTRSESERAEKEFRPEGVQPIREDAGNRSSDTQSSQSHLADTDTTSPSRFGGELCEGESEAFGVRDRVEGSGESSKSDLADTECQQDNQEQSRPEKIERGRGADCSSGCGMVDQGHMADTDQVRRGRGSGEPGPAGRGEFEDGNFWSNSVWLPCADGKVRRAPDDSFGLVDGLQPGVSGELGPLHRSVLAALGNSILPQVAFQIIQAIVRAEETQ